MFNIETEDEAYGGTIATFLRSGFTSAYRTSEDVVADVTGAILATSQIRFGPMPNPESLVAIRRVVRRATEEGRPVPLLMPWGSRKPRLETGIDVAEVASMKTLQCLSDRVKAVYAPGVHVRIRVEDATGMVLFAPEGTEVLRASERYVDDFMMLVGVLKPDGVDPVLESAMMGMGDISNLVSKFEPLFVAYLLASEIVGQDTKERRALPEFKRLTEECWLGVIPDEQREFYYSRYAKQNPMLTHLEHVQMLGRYFATVLARVRLKGSGAHPDWKDYIKLSFAPPVPGSPKDVVETAVSYRTVPTKYSMTHIPPWRAKGYLRMTNEGSCPKIAGYNQDLPALVKAEATLRNGGLAVRVRTDYSI